MEFPSPTLYMVTTIPDLRILFPVHGIFNIISNIFFDSF